MHNFSEPYANEAEIEELFKKDEDLCVVCGCVSANEFFSFPNDVDTRQQWATFCEIPLDKIKPHFRLCDRHFKPDDYRISMKRSIHPSSIPTLQPKLKHGFGPSTTNNSSQSSLNGISISNSMLNENTSNNATHRPVVQVVPAEIDSNIAEDTRDRGLAIYSSEKSKDSSSISKALPTHHYEKVAFGETTVNDVEGTHHHQSLTTSLLEKLNDDSCNTNTQLFEPQQLHSEKVALVESVEKIADEDGYSTDSSMPPLEISSDDVDSLEDPLDQFSEKGPLAELIDNIIEDHHYAKSFMLPLEISSDDLHNPEEQLENIFDQVALVETAQGIAEDARNTNFSMNAAPGQYSEGEVYVEHDDEDNQFPNFAVLSPQKSNDDSRYNIESQSQQCSEKVSIDLPSKYLRNCFPDPTKTTNDGEVVSGISVSPQTNCEMLTNDTAASSNNAQLFDEAYFGRTLRVEVVRVPLTIQESNCNDELNVSQRNEQTSLSAESSKRRKNGDEGRLTCSAKKTKELPSVATTTQTSGSVPKKVVGALIRDSPPYCCNICDKTFSDKSDWTRHQREHAKPFQCPKCKKTFSKKHDLFRHQASHSEMRPYKCGFCDTRFKQNYAKLRHERYMHAEVPCFECAVCGKMFNYKHSIIAHLRIHSGQKPFHCRTCGKKFCFKGSLTRHELTHNNNNNFKCRICGKVFRYQHYKTNHERLHVESSRFECAQCGKKYSHKSSLAHHISSNCS
ncbi:uncharacterized protein LOC135845213 [Planococcus citri]|uniref:uncharacterized protein LOC135845213 n=1 Tax=Planococcus citri TaxID=170843 RepID=UPI0031F79A9D